MSKDDFNSKVGKSALDGLLNRKKPEPVAIPSYDYGSYERYPEGYSSRGGSDMFGGSSSRRSDGVTTTQPAWQGNEKLASRGDVSSQVQFEADGKHAVVGENGMRNIRVAVRGKILAELRNRGVHVKLGHDYKIDDFVQHLLSSGSCQVRKKQGTGFLTVKSDDWFEDELDFGFDGEL